MNSQDKANKMLQEAASDGNMPMVVHLLTRSGVRADAHANEEYALRAACYSGHAEIVEYLMNYSDITEDSYLIAAEMGHVDVLKILSRAPEFINQSIISEAYRGAYFRNHLEVLEHLILHHEALDVELPLSYRNSHYRIEKKTQELIKNYKLIRDEKQGLEHTLKSAETARSVIKL